MLPAQLFINYSGGSFLLRPSKYRYRLCAVAVHAGRADSGHFMTYRRGIGQRSDQLWFLTSDLSVEEVSFEEMKNSEAYMLFYERM